MKKLIEWIVVQLAKWCIKKDRVFFITGGPKGQTVYLIRYILFKSKYGCIYIHRFMRSDADDPHDHPWNFFTYVVSGGYTEIFYDTKRPERSSDMEQFYSFWSMEKNERSAGSIAYRRATDIHQVVVDKPRNMEDVHKAPLTICLMGPRLREWGFWPLKDKGSKWIDWRKYLNITPNDARIEGSE